MPGMWMCGITGISLPVMCLCGITGLSLPGMCGNVVMPLLSCSRHFYCGHFIVLLLPGGAPHRCSPT